jgi:hypothetical protein
VTRYRKLPGNAIVRLLDSLDDDEQLQRRGVHAYAEQVYHSELEWNLSGRQQWNTTTFHEYDCSAALRQQSKGYRDSDRSLGGRRCAGVEVAEVSSPDRAARRRQGKSDPLDAYGAARAVLAGHGLAVPEDAHTGALRALLSARRSAVKAQIAATNQIHALLVTAPAELRERYRRHSTTALVKALARWRPVTHSDPTTVAVLTAAKALAQRTEFLERQKQDLTAQLDVLVCQINPALRAAYGIGADTAAQLLATAGTNPHRLRNEACFAALCGAAPVPASSGKITRHRFHPPQPPPPRAISHTYF